MNTTRPVSLRLRLMAPRLPLYLNTSVPPFGLWTLACPSQGYRPTIGNALDTLAAASGCASSGPPRLSRPSKHVPAGPSIAWPACPPRPPRRCCAPPCSSATRRLTRSSCPSLGGRCRCSTPPASATSTWPCARAAASSTSRTWARSKRLAPTALALLQRLLSNDASAIPRGGAQYSVLCREDGGVLDDLFTYCLGEQTLPDSHQRRQPRPGSGVVSRARLRAWTCASRIACTTTRCSPCRDPRARGIVQALAGASRCLRA